METLAQPAEPTETDLLRAEVADLRDQLAGLRRAVLHGREHAGLLPSARDRAAAAWNLPEGA